MKKTLLILKNEFITVISRKSFLFGAIGVPVLAAAIFGVVTYLNRENPDAMSAVGDIVGIPSGPMELQAEGFVDEAGIIKAIPATQPPSVLMAYQDETAARKAYTDGDIVGFYVIPDDFMTTGEMYYYQDNPKPTAENDQEWVMHWALRVNLLDGDTQLAMRVINPYDLEVVDLEPKPEGGANVGDDSEGLTYWVAYGTTMIFYVLIMLSASLLLNSIAKEKQTRIIEVLLVSSGRRDLLTATIMGLGLAGLLQAILWVGTSYGILMVSGRTFTFPETFSLDPTILVWGLVFFLLGYGLYASLMAGLGALVPNLREATQATFLVIFPIIIPMFFMTQLIGEPHSTLSLTLGLVPFTSPVAMMTRIAAGGVPLWQPFLAAGLLVITVWLVIRAVAGMFQAQTLLSGQPFKARHFYLALLGRGPKAGGK